MTGHPTLGAALAAFQAELPSIAKGNTANMDGKEGRRSFSYKYADLTDVSSVVLPLLAKHGLSFTAAPTVTTDLGFVLQYRLLFVTGDASARREEEVGGSYPLPVTGTPQAIGSAITYARRYALCAVTGVAPGGDDDDAARAEQETRSAPRRPSVDWLARAEAAPDIESLRAEWRAATSAGASPEVIEAIEQLAADRLQPQRIESGEEEGDAAQ